MDFYRLLINTALPHTIFSIKRFLVLKLVNKTLRVIANHALFALYCKRERTKATDKILLSSQFSVSQTISYMESTHRIPLIQLFSLKEAASQRERNLRKTQITTIFRTFQIFPHFFSQEIGQRKGREYSNYRYSGPQQLTKQLNWTKLYITGKLLVSTSRYVKNVNASKK